jgi:hypothetical protein
MSTNIMFNTRQPVLLISQFREVIGPLFGGQVRSIGGVSSTLDSEVFARQLIFV